MIAFIQESVNQIGQQKISSSDAAQRLFSFSASLTLDQLEDEYGKYPGPPFPQIGHCLVLVTFQLESLVELRNFIGLIGETNSVVYQNLSRMIAELITDILKTLMIEHPFFDHQRFLIWEMEESGVTEEAGGEEEIDEPEESEESEGPDEEAGEPEETEEFVESEETKEPKETKESEESEEPEETEELDEDRTEGLLTDDQLWIEIYGEEMEDEDNPPNFPFWYREDYFLDSADLIPTNTEYYYTV